MPEHDIRVGILGATGYIGTPYRDEIRACPGVKIVALCARRRDLLEKAAAKDGAELATADWREVLEHPGVTFVIVATLDAVHWRLRQGSRDRAGGPARRGQRRRLPLVQSAPRRDALDLAR